MTRSDPKETFLYGCPMFLRRIRKYNTSCYGGLRKSALVPSKSTDEPVDLEKFIQKIVENAKATGTKTSYFEFKTHLLYNYLTYFDTPHSYSFSPANWPGLADDPNDFMLGAEFEMMVRKEIVENLDLSFPFDSNWIIVKKDSSLGASGREFVTAPIPKKLCLDETLWRGLLLFLKQYGSARRNVNGLHFHANIEYMSHGIGDESIKSIGWPTAHMLVVNACYKTYLALQEHAPLFLLMVFGRKPNTYCYKLPKINVLKQNVALSFRDRSFSKSPVTDLLHDKLSFFSSLSRKETDKLLSILNKEDANPLLKKIVETLGTPIIDRKAFNLLFTDEFCDAILTERHGALNVLKGTALVRGGTVEFRAGAGNLNFSSVWVIVHFIYAFTTFVRNMIRKGDGLLYDSDCTSSLNGDMKTLAKRFLEWTRNKTSCSQLRAYCHEALLSLLDASYIVTLPDNPYRDAADAEKFNLNTFENIFRSTIENNGQERREECA